MAPNLLTQDIIESARWTHNRINIRPDLPPTAAGTESGIHLHYTFCTPPPSVPKKGTVLLLHGFPQTWYQFRRVITPISDAGYLVIAPDYRGAGDSTKPSEEAGVFRKDVMAEDLHLLVQALVGEERVHVVGHDIGGMVAHAYATQFPDSTASACWGECPIPGSTYYETHKRDPQFWHFSFHAIPDLPELLVSGEKIAPYLSHFITRHAQNPSAISPADRQVYVEAYSSAGGIRCGMGVYRALELDAEWNIRMVRERGRSKVRCLTLWGGASWMGVEDARMMAGEFYGGFEVGWVEGCGHWVAEEAPRGFVEAVVGWVGRGQGVEALG